MDQQMTYISSSCEINVKVYLKHYLELRILKNINNSVTLNGWDIKYSHQMDFFFEGKDVDNTGIVPVSHIFLS